MCCIISIVLKIVNLVIVNVLPLLSKYTCNFYFILFYLFIFFAFARMVPTENVFVLFVSKFPNNSDDERSI